MQTKTSIDLLPDEVLSNMTLNQSPATQGAIISTCKKYYHLFQPKRLADKLLWTVTAGDQKQAERILAEFIDDNKWLHKINSHQTLEHIVQHPASSLELRLLALIALTKIIGEQYIQTPGKVLLNQFISTVQRVILMGNVNKYYEPMLWVLLEKITRALDVNDCFELHDGEEPLFDLKGVLDALDGTDEYCRYSRDNAFHYADKILRYIDPDSRQIIYQVAFLALNDKKYFIKTNARRICISMWPYLDTQQHQEILDKSPDLFRKEEKRLPMELTQIISVVN